MSPDEFRKEVEVLALKAEKRFAQMPDFQSVEPLYDLILELVQSDLSFRPVFKGQLLELLFSDHDHLELIEYCAHALRWPELKASFEELLAATKDLRARYVIERILNAFDDNWDLRDVYRRWSES